MKKTLEWTAPEHTVVDSISVLTLGLETLILRIGALDAREAANAGAMRALDDSVRLPLQDVVEDSLEWVGDVNLALSLDADSAPSSPQRKAVLSDCFTARSDLRKAATGLERERENVYATLTQLKDIATSVRSALTTVVEGVDALGEVDEIPHDIDDVDDESSDVSHEYRQSKQSRVERVINRASPAANQESTESVVLFTEVSKARGAWSGRRFDGLRKERKSRFSRPRRRGGWSNNSPAKVR